MLTEPATLIYLVSAAPACIVPGVPTKPLPLYLVLCPPETESSQIDLIPVVWPGLVREPLLCC